MSLSRRSCGPTLKSGHRLPKLTLFGLVLALVLAACGSDDDGGGETPSPTSADTGAPTEQPSATDEPSPDAEALPVRIVVASDSLAFMDTWVAQGAGTMEAAGLEPEWLPSVPDAAQAMATVISGDTDVVNIAAAAPIGAVGADRDVKMFACTVVGVTSFMTLRAEVADRLEAEEGVTPDSPIEDRLRALEGLTIGTGSAGGPIEIRVRTALADVGLDPDTAISYQSGTPDATFAAFTSGQIDGFVTGVPNSLAPVVDGTGVIWASGPEKAIPSWSSGYFLGWATSTQFAEENPEVLERIIAGIQGAADLLENDLDGAIEALQPKYTDLDPALLEASVEAQREAYITDGTCDEDIMQQTIDAFNAGSDNPADVTAEDVVADGFLS